MIDVQPAPSAQPNVFDAMPTVSPSNALTRVGGTVLHVERDVSYVLAVRQMRGTCTRDEWDSPSHRRLAIARAWERCVQALRAEDEQLVTFAPVTLYRDARGEVQFADVSLPGKPRKLITANGTVILSAPADLALHYTAERTTYARWAEGPMPHLSLDMASAPTPDDDPQIQALRHQNGALRDLIDSALAPAEWAPTANTVTDAGLVDFVIRGVIRRQDYRQLVSAQTGEVSGLLVDGGVVEILPEVTAAPTNEAALDALLEAK